MSRPLSKCQSVAFGAGWLLCAILVGVELLILEPLGDFFPQRNEYALSIWVPSLALFSLAAAFAFGVARYAGQNDKVAFITCAVPALAVFFMGYLADINTRIESTARHCMTGGYVGYVPPLDLIGQISNLFFPVLWASLAAVTGVGLHRLTRKRSPMEEGEPTVEHTHAFRWFIFSLGVALVLILIGYSIYVTAKNTPGGRVSDARKVLSHANSSSAEKHRALWDMWRLPGEESTKILQDAARNQPLPVNVLAAVCLASRNDITGLPLLEKELLKSSELRTGAGNVKLGLLLGRIDNPAAIPILTSLMKAPDKDTRIGAAEALKNTKSKSAIEPLIGGLYDDDREVRWICVLGLAEVVGRAEGEKSWWPSKDDFQRNERLYLDHWRQWSKNRDQQQDQEPGVL